jgi:hypothetical protein
MTFLSSFFAWFRNLFRRKSKSTHYTIPYTSAREYVQFKMSKAYADERQKQPRNRKRKPNKHMRNLYQSLH